jgi:hypothetical protein
LERFIDQRPIYVIDVSTVEFFPQNLFGSVISEATARVKQADLNRSNTPFGFGIAPFLPSGWQNGAKIVH